jgi:tRNA pseudouridine13 synthase
MWSGRSACCGVTARLAVGAPRVSCCPRCRRRSLFVVEDPAREAARAAAFEISPTGPIFGKRVLAPTGAVAERERSALAAYGVDLARLSPPAGIRLRGARRTMRARPEAALITRSGDRMRLRFALPSGSYATVLIEELLDTALEEGFE